MLCLLVACALALVTSFHLRFSCWALPDVVLRGLIFSSKNQERRYRNYHGQCSILSRALLIHRRRLTFRNPFGKRVVFRLSIGLNLSLQVWLLSVIALISRHNLPCHLQRLGSIFFAPWALLFAFFIYSQCRGRCLNLPPISFAILLASRSSICAS